MSGFEDGILCKRCPTNHRQAVENERLRAALGFIEDAARVGNVTGTVANGANSRLSIREFCGVALSANQ